MNTLQHIKTWFETAVPSPIDDNRRVQHGCHVEEVAEMFDAVGDTLEAGRLFTMASAYKRGPMPMVIPSVRLPFAGLRFALLPPVPMVKENTAGIHLMKDF